MLVFSSCNRQEQQPEVLASKIQYDVPIVGNNPQLDWWINNLEGSSREPFIKRLMEVALEGKISIYDYFNKPMTPAQLKSSLSDTIFQTLVRNQPPYEEYDTVIIKTVDYRAIDKVRFLEEWSWDPDSMELTKHILGFGPVIETEIAGQHYNRLLFWIYLDNRYPVK